ncbi:DUF1559 domain-containing protein [Bremerella cremea]|uniref:DUF1559 domain-containing protein n=1 Tax=Bremerella cremea TaxID=1031537 RepID=A0A368KLG8_9BACT|nr:DUF1559 domain-containing protein [Bremerella cremea]RCS40670.1 DUF1559 domain-containing protein [Bremerella cremea]
MVRWSIPLLLVVFASVLAFGCSDSIFSHKVCCAGPPAELVSSEKQLHKRMAQIIQGLRAYHEEFGTLPPAYTTDENGQPLTSWRVLILPQMGFQAIYDQYDQSQPWDSPANQAWANQTPAPYQDPLYTDGEPGWTTFVGIVGAGLPLGANGSAGRSLWSDSLTNGALLVEDLAQPVIWSQPVDRSPDEILARESLRCEKAPYLNVGLADEKVWQFTDATRHTLEQLLRPEDNSTPENTVEHP